MCSLYKIEEITHKSEICRFRRIVSQGFVKNGIIINYRIQSKAYLTAIVTFGRGDKQDENWLYGISPLLWFVLFAKKTLNRDFKVV